MHSPAQAQAARHQLLRALTVHDLCLRRPHSQAKHFSLRLQRCMEHQGLPWPCPHHGHTTEPRPDHAYLGARPAFSNACVDTNAAIKGSRTDFSSHGRAVLPCHAGGTDITPPEITSLHLRRVMNPLRVGYLLFNGCRASPGITSACLQWVCWNICRGVRPQIGPVPGLPRLQCSASRTKQHVKTLAEHSLGHAAGHGFQSTPAMHACRRSGTMCPMCPACWGPSSSLINAQRSAQPITQVKAFGATGKEHTA